MILFSALGISFVVWLIVVLTHRIRSGNWRFTQFKFSENNYHLMLMGFPLGVLLTSFLSHSPSPIALFVFFALIGVAGELLFSMWWHAFYGQRFWVYSVDTLYHSYTSMLNFIPWGVGGIWALQIGQEAIGKEEFKRIFSDPNMYGTLALVYFGSLALQLGLFYFIKKFHNGHYRFHEVTFNNYLFFVFPILAVIAFFIFTYSLSFLILALTYAVFLSLAEYLFGKATSLFVSRRLWTYTYMPWDNGHFTPLSLIPFTVGGFYFLIVYGFFSSFLIR